MHARSLDAATYPPPVNGRVTPHVPAKRWLQFRNGHRDNAVYWLYAIGFAITLEGAARKWLLPPSLHGAAYALKDLLALAFIVRFPLLHVSREFRSLQRACFLIGVCLLPAFIIGELRGPTAALLTFKNAVIWPLFAIHLAARATPLMRRRFATWLSLFAAVSAVLGVLQAFSPASAWINANAWDHYGIQRSQAGFGFVQLTRASGTFSYLSGLATFGATACIFLLWRYFSSAGRYDKGMSALGATAALICALSSGSRSPLAVIAVAVCGTLLITGKIQVLIRLSCFIIILTIAYIWVGDDLLVRSYFERASTAEDTVTERVIGAGLQFVNFIVDNPIGEGLGNRSQLPTFSASLNDGQLRMLTIEDGRVRLAQEAGVASIVVLLLTISIPVVLIRKCLRRNNLEARAAAGVFGAVSLYTCASGVLWYDHISAALWWTVIAMWGSVVNAQLLQTNSRMMQR